MFIFIVVVILDCLDFWTVKNITGRLLVGLRWWNEFSENGEEKWVYESHEGDHKPNTIDSSFFWMS